MSAGDWRKNGNSAPVKPKYLGKDEDEDHSHVDFRFVDVCANALCPGERVCQSWQQNGHGGGRTASPTYPTEYPAAIPVRPHASPAPRCTKPL